jgi:hypothetical protein
MRWVASFFPCHSKAFFSCVEFALPWHRKDSNRLGPAMTCQGPGAKQKKWTPYTQIVDILAKAYRFI